MTDRYLREPPQWHLLAIPALALLAIPLLQGGRPRDLAVLLVVLAASVAAASVTTMGVDALLTLRSTRAGRMRALACSMLTPLVAATLSWASAPGRPLSSVLASVGAGWASAWGWAMAFGIPVGFILGWGLSEYGWEKGSSIANWPPESILATTGLELGCRYALVPEGTGDGWRCYDLAPALKRQGRPMACDLCDPAHPGEGERFAVVRVLTWTWDYFSRYSCEARAERFQSLAEVPLLVELKKLSR